MEDRRFEDLDDKAREYVKVRDKRQDLTRREVELKSDLLGLLKKHKKTEYHHEDIDIWIVVEQESVKVKVAKKDEDEEE